ncbi:hypothetical protein [Planococcus shixiaomingii]|uniref:hypothetical protein n=1 Tax=Planococcus shixiaomingii TaxID=3058393 RepID=UPI00261CCA90|nr:hypothetical protein [Planococcus sp. N022]WKA53187.1 hypothetical protein QWY21_11005 [Planococcus sp. N022]
MKSIKLFMLLIVSVLVLCGCSEKGSSEEKSTTDDKEEIVKAIEEKNLPVLKEYIKTNTPNIESDVTTFKLAQKVLIEENKNDYLVFMEEWSKELIHDRDYRSLNSLIDTSADYINISEKEIIYDLIPEIKKNETDDLKRKKENEENLSFLKTVSNEFNFNINDLPSDFSYYEYYGEVVQKIDSNTYLVNHIVLDSPVRQNILKTSNQEFNSTGTFLMNAIVLGTETFEMQNGFTETFEVIYEIPNDKMKLLEEISIAKRSVAENEVMIKQNEMVLGNSKADLNNTIESLWIDPDLSVDEIETTFIEYDEASEEQKWEEGYEEEDWETVLNNVIDLEVEIEMAHTFQSLTKSVNAISVEKIGYNLFHGRSIAVYESENEYRYSGEAEKFFVLATKNDVVKQIVYVDDVELGTLDNTRLLSILLGVTPGWSDEQIKQLFEEGEVVNGGYIFKMSIGKTAFKVDIRKEA